jgi:hypothetical protein
MISRGRSLRQRSRSPFLLALRGTHSCSERSNVFQSRTKAKWHRPITRQQPATKPRQIHCQRQMAHTLVRATNPLSIGAATYLPKD